MARPERNNVDYFPFLCKEGKAMFIIENKYGNDGYAVWVKILRQLAVTNYHYLNLSDPAEFMFLSTKCRVSETVLENIVNDLSKLGEINPGLWQKHRIVFSEKFIDNIQEAYSKRNNKCISLPGLLPLLSGLGILKLHESGNNSTVNTHSIVENTIKEKRRVFIVPTQIEIETFIFENLTEVPNEKIKDFAAAFFDYYSANGWKVGRSAMKDWYAAVRNWIRNEKKYKQNGSTNSNGQPEKRFGRLSESSVRNVRDRPELPLPD